LNIGEKKLIMFDFDGTLIDSGPDLALALNFMLEKLGRKPFSEEMIHGWVGNGAQTLVKRALLGKTEISETLEEGLFTKALKIFLESYEKNICVKTLLYPHVKDTLEVLQKKDYILSIVTNKPYDFIEPILEGLHIKDYFDYFIGGDSLKEKKPSPLPLLHICEKFKINTTKALMVGDSKNDILAAHAAKIDSIGVSYGYNYGEDIAISQPSIVLHDFRKILEVL
jgi:phosphoglycolate phosphatase